jgi:hypothetical protein
VVSAFETPNLIIIDTNTDVAKIDPRATKFTDAAGNELKAATLSDHIRTASNVEVIRDKTGKVVEVKIVSK